MHIISIVGKHNIGKTYLLEQIISNLIKKYQIAVIKHTIHEIKKDEVETDTFRLRKAGSNLTAISSDNDLIIFFKGTNLNSKQLLSIFHILDPDIDILFLEGYKKEPYPKIIIIDDLMYLDQFNPDEILLVISKKPELINNEIIDFNDLDIIIKKIESFIKARK
ncbi:MAG: molybdopterin-guanine dinucleotide biosynthesis protein B [Candidatus Lokiarchaeota archaeon]|nr:molybdopterin-guanine dinucleotide biosynthesis protein B [Candidatus Lokiarchaeota archaeon]